MRIGANRSQLYDAQKKARAKWDAVGEVWVDDSRVSFDERVWRGFQRIVTENVDRQRFRLSGPVWTEAFTGDGLFAFDPAAPKTSVALLGFVTIELDFSGPVSASEARHAVVDPQATERAFGLPAPSDDAVFASIEAAVDYHVEAARARAAAAR